MENLDDLKILSIYNTPVNDISVLLEMDNLEKLYISKNKHATSIDEDIEKLKSRGVEIIYDSNFENCRYTDWGGYLS